MHTLCVGITESGKTTLLKKLAQKHKRNGFDVVVLTPIYESWGEGIYVFDDQEEFLRYFWQTKKCFVIIDEGKTTAGRFNVAMEETATAGRHWGHSCYYAAQGATMISPDIRKNCTQLFCFAQGPADSKALTEEWRAPELAKEAPDLAQGEFFLVRKFGADGKRYCQKMNAFEFEG